MWINKYELQLVFSLATTLYLPNNYNKVQHFTIKYKYVNKLKTLSKIKKEQYRGLRTEIAEKLDLKTYKVDNVFRGRCKDALLVAEIRRVATQLLESYNNQLKSIYDHRNN
jgi:hypothetical protein